MADAQTLRQLKIKTGVVKRLSKEEKTYAQEAEEQKARIERITKEGADEWDIKKQHEVLRDCEQMIPDCARRLAAAVEDLQALLDGLEGDAASSEEAKAAQEALEGAKHSESA